MKKKVIAAIIAVLIVAGAATGIGIALKNKGTRGGQADASGKMTLMVYMLGSDLESKSGAGTEDLEEMAASGVDLSKVNVIVYAGGSKSWQNEDIPQDKNTVLHLTEKGFTVEKKFSSASMGEAKTLADFINYAYKNYPADRYAMIFWDHGNGPVIGYGKDMLFGKDSLTLSEMKEAIGASPFGPDNKLCFVGFDACLMASAELTLVWADYADYLVASQETEPAFGWKYSFLSAVNGADTGAMLGTVTTEYLASCEEYYDERGFENRDTTLSCVDLSKAGALSDAIENLFGAASGFINDDYNLFAVSRVQTRALGRATTGSEYDLVDLADMAAQLQVICPKESEALQNAIGDMVTSNATNAQQCCGMSLYYPFYNKYYYGSGWAEAYEELGILPNYLSYLKTYAENWLVDETEVEEYATSITPAVSTSGTYTVTLTPEEKERFASATFHILRKEGNEAYCLIYSSRDVTETDGVLSANFDGKIIYITNKFYEYGIPTVTMEDKVGQFTRYSFPVTLNNTYADYPFVEGSLKLRNMLLDEDSSKNEYGKEILLMPQLDNFEVKYEYCSYQLVVNNETGKISVAALVPRAQNAKATDLLTGKVEDVNPDEWTYLYFPESRHRMITRSDSGLILPIDSWLANDVLSANSLPIRDGIRFIYEDLTDGEYRLIFEITDTQGNKYCTEPIEVETGEVEVPSYPYTQNDVTWADGDQMTVYDGDEVMVSVEKLADKSNTVLFRVRNKTDRDIKFKANKMLLNDQIYTDDVVLYYIPAGKTEVDEFEFSADLLFEPDPIRIQSLRFEIGAEDINTAETVCRNQIVNVTFADSTAITLDPAESYLSFSDNAVSLDVPFCGITAKNRQAYNENGVQIDLLGFGRAKEDDTDGYVVLRIGNTTDNDVYLNTDVILLDDTVIPAATRVTAPPHSVIYKKILIDGDDISVCGLNSASSLTLEFRFAQSDMQGFIGAGEVVYCPIALDGQLTSSTDFKEGKNVIFSDHGIRIAVLTDADESGNRYVSVVNDSDEDISLDLLSVVDGKEISSEIFTGNYFHDAQFKAHTRGVCKLAVDTEENNVSFRILIQSFTGDKLLYTADKITTLK